MSHASWSEYNVAQPACPIGDLPLRAVLSPQSAADVGDAVRRAAAEGLAIYPLGGRTLLDYGLPPTRPGLGIDLRNLVGVIDYPARDMTVTVQAGITLAGLRQLLRAENQRLPIDVPRADRATLGGVLATNASGPRRYGCGTLRDYVIGISVVNDEGQEVKAGGRVVKNVAGYDLCKLYVGSLGTLGVISQITLKLRPLPEEHALITLGCPEEAVGPLLDRLHGSRTRPVCLDLLNRAAVGYVNRRAGAALPEGPWVLAVGFEDNREAVNWQVQQLIQELPTGLALGLDVRVSQAAEPFWEALVEFSARAEARLVFKANLLPSATGDFCRALAGLPEQPLLQAHAGNGIVIGQVDGDLTLAQAQAMLKRVLEWATAARGNVVVLRCPADWKTALPIWGAPRDDSWLMRAIKQELDPRGLFNPGRFVDGL